MSDAEKIVAIIQARLGSNRLPLKSLLSLKQKPIIDWVVDRVSAATRIDKVIVAIPDTTLDQVLADHLHERGIEFFAGPENDVLERFQGAASQAGADIVVRVCADNPLVWGRALDRLVGFYKNSNLDYAYNHIPKNNLWPDGLGAEIFSARLLAEMASHAALPSQREHCCNYIWDNPEKFRIGTFDPEEAWLRRPDIKLDIDKAEDYQKLALLPVNPQMNAAEIIKLFPVKPV